MPTKIQQQPHTSESSLRHAIANAGGLLSNGGYVIFEYQRPSCSVSRSKDDLKSITTTVSDPGSTMDPIAKVSKNIPIFSVSYKLSPSGMSC